jgi:transcriptional regulator with XRE-family HTH domain
MTGKEFKLARKKLGWSQCDVAARLGVSQTYVTFLERNKRPFPPRLARKAVSLLGMSPSALPLSPKSSKTPDWVRQLSALGYPGYAHVPPVHRRNPAEVLLAALEKDNLDARVVEALPWLLLRYATMSNGCRMWMVEQAHLRGLTNRLGFTVTLAKKVAERSNQTTSDSYRVLVQLEKELFQSRLAKSDTFCQNDLSQRQREWMKSARPEEARMWNLLTNWRPEDLQYAQTSFTVA